MNTKTYTDIKTEHWSIRYLPARWRPYALLARLDRPIGIWLLLLPGWWAIALAAGGAQGVSAHVFWLMVLFAIGAVVMRAAGCIVNDLWDIDLDKQVERTSVRPLASGMLSKKQAVSFLFLLLLVGLVILLQMPVVTIMLGVISLPLIATYPLMKRVTYWPQAFLGLVFNFGALMGWSAVTGDLAWPAILLYISGIFWTLGYDTIYAAQDREDDALVGIKSTALKFGERIRVALVIFYMAHLGAIGAAIAMAAGWEQVVFMLPVAAHLGWQVFTFKPDDPDNALKRFKSNRDYALIVWLILIMI